MFHCRELLELELEAVGIRLNKRRPNIYFKVTAIQAQIYNHNELCSFVSGIYNRLIKITVHVYVDQKFKTPGI